VETSRNQLSVALASEELPDPDFEDDCKGIYVVYRYFIHSTHHFVTKLNEFDFKHLIIKAGMPDGMLSSNPLLVFIKYLSRQTTLEHFYRAQQNLSSLHTK
jgi:hypothetical protein